MRTFLKTHTFFKTLNFLDILKHVHFLRRVRFFPEKFGERVRFLNVKKVCVYKIERITKKARVSKNVRLNKNRSFYKLVIVSKNFGVIKKEGASKI